MSGNKQFRWFLSLLLSAVLCFGEMGGTGVVLAAAAGAEAVEEVPAEAETDGAFAPDGEAVPEAGSDVIEPAGDTEYNLWVGGVQVTDANKDDIPGVTSGKAVYDTASKTLTLKGVKGFKGTYDRGDSRKYYIFSGIRQGIYLKGDAAFTLGDEEYGIYTYEGLTTDADLTIRGSGVGIYNNQGWLRIQGGNVDVRSTANGADECCIGCDGDLDITQATVRAVGGEYAIGAKGYVNIARSKVYAEGDKYGIYCREPAGTSTPFRIDHRPGRRFNG